jgi:hypothetical protein
MSSFFKMMSFKGDMIRFFPFIFPGMQIAWLFMIGITSLVEKWLPVTVCMFRVPEMLFWQVYGISWSHLEHAPVTY